MTAGGGTDSTLAVAFVLEQTLGHVTHSANLRSLVPDHPDVEAHFVPVEFEPGRLAVPGWSNWTVRAGIRARRGLAALRRRRGRDVDALFVHTQVPAVLLGRWMRRTPTVVSIDATPRQYDSLGEFYAHDVGPGWLERAKFLANRRAFRRAVHLITWSEWARRGLSDEYAVPLEDITVIAPGVDLDRWRHPGGRRDAEAPSETRPLQILFVGGDLRRKGGDLLIEAGRRLRAEPGVPPFEIHLVSNAETEPEPGLVAHRGLTANSPALIERYHAADIFCLPTLGDCLPMVLAEAAAAGLPLVSTDVGAISEIVEPGITGELIPGGDGEALTDALRRLLVDPDHRASCGEAALRVAERDHDARKNAGRIVAALRAAARP